MKSKPAVTVFLWSLASFGVATALILPGSLQADGPEKAGKLVVVPKSISTDRVELSVKLEDSNEQRTDSQPIQIQSGKAPKLKLVASNKTALALAVPVKIAMESSGPVDRLSRVGPATKEIWHYDRELTLAPGKTDQIDLVCDVKLEAGSFGFITLRASEKVAYPFQFVVKDAGR
jgi:hypothetical protein